MQKEFNSCANLIDKEIVKEFETFKKDIENPLEYLFNMQLHLQRELNKKLPEQTTDVDNLNTVGEIYDFLRDNKIAFDDEFSELVDALGGMSNNAKDRTSIWKKWKKNHNEMRAQKLEEFSDDDRKELNFEFIDMLHFFLNMMIALKITPDDVLLYYFVKNKENLDRYNRGY